MSLKELLAVYTSLDMHRELATYLKNGGSTVLASNLFKSILKPMHDSEFRSFAVNDAAGNTMVLLHEDKVKKVLKAAMSKGRSILSLKTNNDVSLWREASEASVVIIELIFGAAFNKSVCLNHVAGHDMADSLLIEIATNFNVEKGVTE